MYGFGRLTQCGVLSVFNHSTFDILGEDEPLPVADEAPHRAMAEGK